MLPPPSGLFNGELQSITCVQPRVCQARRMEVSFEANALVETLRGRTWTPTTGLDGGGSANSFLFEVSCRTSSICVAVGVKNGSPWVINGAGARWTTATIPLPPHAVFDNIEAVSCPNDLTCIGAGTATVLIRNQGGVRYGRPDPVVVIDQRAPCSPAEDRGELCARLDSTHAPLSRPCIVTTPTESLGRKWTNTRPKLCCPSPPGGRAP